MEEKVYKPLVISEQTLRKRAANKRWYKKNKERTIARSKRWAKENRLSRLVVAAKSRAKNQGLPFNPKVSDLILPKFCPALGIRLMWSHSYRSGSNPSIDRIIPSLGYIKGNVQIISWRANRIKSDSTPTEIKKVSDYMQRTQC